jgi:RNase adaptor protein for sRNA GlmZ degradation
VLLKPSVSEIMRRIASRGRPHDLQHLPECRRNVEHQLRILEADTTIRAHRMIDTTRLSVNEVVQTCLEFLNSRPGP